MIRSRTSSVESLNTEDIKLKTNNRTPNYEELKIEHCSTLELLTYMVNHYRSKNRASKAQTKFFEETIVERIQLLEQENTKLKEREITVQNKNVKSPKILDSQTKNLQTELYLLKHKHNMLKEKYDRLETECNDWKEELKRKHQDVILIQDMHKTIKELIEERQTLLLETTEKELEQNDKGTDQMMKNELRRRNEEILKLKEKIKEDEKIINQLTIIRNSLSEENIYIKEEFVKKNKQIELMDNIFQKYEEQIKSLERTANQENPQKQTEENTSYAAKAKINKIIENEQQNQTALLIKKTSNITLNALKDKLYNELKGNIDMKEINCNVARDRKTLIIKALNEKFIDKIADKIQESETLKDITEITIKNTFMKKIIVLGIPKEITSEMVKNTLKEMFTEPIEVNCIKGISQEKNKTYQLILELNNIHARQLTEKGKIPLGFYMCRIAQYAPVIRCSNCQAYGHNNTNCGYATMCGICMEQHETESCKFRETKRKHKCVNCFYNDVKNYNHTTFSGSCPYYLSKLKQRNLAFNPAVRSR